jgi:hypothetical protein
LLFIGIIAHLVQPDPEIPRAALIISEAIAFVFAAIAYQLLRKTVPIQTRPCPNCGSREYQPAGVLTAAAACFCDTPAAGSLKASGVKASANKYRAEIAAHSTSPKQKAPAHGESPPGFSFSYS